MNYAATLELLNGAAIVPAIIVTVLLTRYLVKESHRRGLHGLDWFHLPAGMNLVLAMFLFNNAVLGERIIKWAWRRFLGADDFGIAESGALIFCGALIVIGSLCKVRALTHPDFGNGPWLMATAISAAAVVALLVFR